jgi:cytochrome c oxidase cbb3-type subunit I/II
VKRAKVIALTAGFVFIMAAIGVQALIPYFTRDTHTTKVSTWVRTDLGLLQEVDGEARPYQGKVKRGREIFIREGCWYCHSMYVRPVAGEDRRWGPVSQAGEYAYDIPHTMSTRRIGPDIIREGGKYGDDWHRAHFFNPRLVVPDSIMPGFPWFYKKYEKPAEEEQEEAGRKLTEGERQRVLPVESEFVPNEDGEAVIAFVQFLGMNRGKWRNAYISRLAGEGSNAIADNASLARGKKSFNRRCAGCHGKDGKGDGPAARFFRKVKPRNFTRGVFKFRSTPTGSLPLDTDLYRTITIGVRGTAMPPWNMLPESERWDIIQYIKTFSPAFKKEKPGKPVYVPEAPEPTPAMLARGKNLYEKFQCWQCHAKDGEGDGPAAVGMTDDLGNPILPANFTNGQWKVGPRPGDIFRTLMTGLNGTPMPSYRSFLQSESDTWALSYYVLSFAAE